MEFITSNWPLASGLFVLGVSIQLLLRKYLNYHAKAQAQQQADELLEQANDFLEEQMDYAKENARDFEDEIYQKNQNDFERLENRIAKNKEKVEAIQHEIKEYVGHRKKQFDKRKSVVDHYSNLVDAKSAKYKIKRDEINKHKQIYTEKLLQQTEDKKEDIVNSLAQKYETEAKNRASDYLEECDNELQLTAERKAKRIINIALNRFARAYCPDRGLGFLVMRDQREAEKVMGPNKENIVYLEQLCGIDIIYNEKANSLSVSGFDPVRRELARATLDRMQKQKYIKKETIDKLYKQCKSKLFKKISDDGIRIAKELKLQGLSKEIRNMMGALRYRYSFTQNQYFHCAEVGHICGLIAAELEDNTADARRAGMLHDIGKAMDHSVDGGHAVIGADFIEKNGEEERIVHPVRAHHFDEQPNSDLAYSVIGADAVSGARPGARRSTAVSYHQKMDQLQEIGNSVEGVIDTFILSAGREVRITVDSKDVDDVKALDISKEVADRIEEECNYPGTIRVTVVRQTEATDLAK